MKAIVYNKNKPNLVMKDVEKPVPKEEEVLIKIHSVSINALDYRSMKMGIIPESKIFGADISGVIEEVGERVQNFQVGDEVLGNIGPSGFGGFAQWVCAPEKLLILKPQEITFDQAASLPVASVTALQALRLGNVGPGKKVLIHGAGGGVGTFSVQLAQNFGAEVTAVCSKRNVEVMKALGVKEIIDYKKERISKIKMRYDAIIGINGNHGLFTYKRLLKKGGIFVSVGGALTQIIKALMFRRLLSIGSKKIKILSTKANTSDLKVVTNLVIEGKVKPVIDRTYSFEETAEAFHYLKQGHSKGKVVVNRFDMV